MFPDSKVHGVNIGQSLDARTQVGPMLDPWTLLSGLLKWVIWVLVWLICISSIKVHESNQNVEFLSFFFRYVIQDKAVQLVMYCFIILRQCLCAVWEKHIMNYSWTIHSWLFSWLIYQLSLNIHFKKAKYLIQSSYDTGVSHLCRLIKCLFDTACWRKYYVVTK